MMDYSEFTLDEVWSSGWQ